MTTGIGARGSFHPVLAESDMKQLCNVVSQSLLDYSQLRLHLRATVETYG
jgi:hypothetical protein